MKNALTVVAAIICGFSIIMVIACKRSEVEKSADQPKVDNAVSKDTVKTNPQMQSTAQDAQIDAKIAELEKILLGKPNDLPTLTELAQSYYAKKMFVRAEADINKALSALPNDFFALRIDGDILAAQNKPEAIEAYQKSIAACGDKENLSKEKSFAYFALGRFYLSQGNKTKALENAEKASDLNKTDKYMSDFLKQLQK